MMTACSFPADGQARIAETLSKDSLDETIEKIKTLRDFEACLRDSCGFSRKQALALVSRVKKVLSEEQRDAALAEALNKVLGVTERIDKALSGKI